MRNYVPPPSLPTYSVLLEGESMSPSMGLLRDDLLNVCMRHVEKICKADLGRNFIERNHMENGRVSETCPFPPQAKPSAGSEEVKCDECPLTEEEVSTSYGGLQSHSSLCSRRVTLPSCRRPAGSLCLAPGSNKPLQDHFTVEDRTDALRELSGSRGNLRRPGQKHGCSHPSTAVLKSSP